jgi:hypothetical protein
MAKLVNKFILLDSLSPCLTVSPANQHASCHQLGAFVNWHNLDLVPFSAASTEMGLHAFTPTCCSNPVLISLLVVRVAYVLCRSGLALLKPHSTGLWCLIVLGSGEYALVVTLKCSILVQRTMSKPQSAGLELN